MTYDLLIVGAGPVGLSTALHARKRGLRALLIDKGTIANHLLAFPTGMAFFTPRHSLELLGIPLDSSHLHATREEIVSYYGRIARLAELELHADRCFERATGSDGNFTAFTRTGDGRVVEYRCRKLVLATGVFGKPRRLSSIPGCELTKVQYLYREPFAFVGRDVLLVGVGNSSAGAALALHHAGARVTVLDRNAAIPALKWRWHLEDLQALIRAEQIRMLHDATLARIEDDAVWIDVAGTQQRLANDAVIVLLGYEPDRELLERSGVVVDHDTKMPAVDVRTLETTTPGIYLAGIVCAGSSPDRIFVWGARHHPKAILHHIAERAPLPELEDLGGATIEHWAQFQKLDDTVDEALALRLVPVVTGEMRDDFFDVYERATHTANLYAETPTRTLGESIGPIIDALEGWLVERNADGSAIFKGQRLSENAFEIVRLCDGSRRISQIITALALEYEQPEHEIQPMVLKLVLSLLRTGKLSWRAVPTPP